MVELAMGSLWHFDSSSGFNQVLNSNIILHIQSTVLASSNTSTAINGISAGTNKMPHIERRDSGGVCAHFCWISDATSCTRINGIWICMIPVRRNVIILYSCMYRTSKTPYTGRIQFHKNINYTGYPCLILHIWIKDSVFILWCQRNNMIAYKWSSSRPSTYCT